MNYKKLMGYGKNKKINKGKSKPKVNKVLNSIKEEFGYKTNIKETAPIQKMDKTKFFKYFDLVLKTAGSDEDKIEVIFKKMGFETREAMIMAKAIGKKVKGME